MASVDPTRPPLKSSATRKSWPWIAAVVLLILILLATRGWQGEGEGLNDRHIDGTDEPGVAPYNK
jgi:hypothetical protein